MQSSLSNILKLIHELTGSLSSCLLRLNKGKEYHVVAYFGLVPLESLNGFLPDIIFMPKEKRGEVKSLPSFNKLSSQFGFNSLYINDIFSQKEKRTSLVLLLLSDENDKFNTHLQNTIRTLEIFLRDFLIEKNWFKQNLDLERIFAKADMGIMLNNAEGKIVFVNRKGLELVKITPEEFSSFSEGNLKLVFFNDDGVALTKDEYPPFKALRLKKNIIDKNIKYIDRDGNQSWFRINSILIKDENSKITEVLSTINDVTQYRNIEEYLKNTASTIESILYSSDLKGTNYFFITDAVKKVLGYNPDEIIQHYKRILRSINIEDFPLFRKFARNLQSGRTSVVEYRIKDRWGRERYLRNSGFPIIQAGEVIRIDGVIVDITDEKKILLELERSEERFRLLIETANDLIFNLDSYGYFVTVNNYGALALGYKPEEMITRHFLEFVDDENKSEIAMAFQQILKSDKVVSFEAAFIDKFGKKIIFEVQGRPTKNKDKVSGLLGIARDITERRKDEEKLKELNSKLIEANRLVSIERDRAKQQVSVLEELNRLKNEFISNISHELRTPLASIVGFSETITSDPEMPRDMVLEFSNIILSEGKRLAKLINDVLDFAKMEAGELAVFKSEMDIVLLLNEIIDSFKPQATEKGIILTSDIPSMRLLIIADKERITQVFQHLISNAIKFTNRGGRITVIAQNFMKEFEVIVSDTGMGIPERDLPNIFQKFFKASRPGTQIPGTGIGLGLVKQIIDLHKGMITVQSELNKGTTFIVKLPKFNSII
ncbi:MAG: PAS domain S-box protein [Clostridiales bacterium]